MTDISSFFDEIIDDVALYGYFEFENGGIVVSVDEMLKLLTREQQLKLIKRIELGLKKRESDCNVIG